MYRLATMVAVVATMLAVAPPPTHARAGDAEDQRATITVAPVSFVATIEPGSTKRGYVDVFNVGDVPVRLRAEVNAIRVKDDGAYELYRSSGSNGIDAFVEVERAPFLLRPGMARRVAFSVSIPANAWTGGYFGSLLFRLLPRAGGSDEAVIQHARVGTLLILRAAGAAEQRGALVDLKATGSPWSRRREFRARFRNTGGSDGPVLGVAYRPRGTVQVTNAFGRRIDHRSLEGRLLLPGESVRLKSRTQRWFWLGRYTATMRIRSGSGGSIQEESVTLWSISWPAGLLILIVTAMASGAAVARRRRRRGKSFER